MSVAPATFLFKATEAFGLFRRGVVVRGVVVEGALSVGQRVVIPGSRRTHTACVTAIELERKLIDETPQGVELGLLLAEFDDPGITHVLEMSGVESCESSLPSPQEILGLTFPLHIHAASTASSSQNQHREA